MRSRALTRLLWRASASSQCLGCLPGAGTAASPSSLPQASSSPACLRVCGFSHAAQPGRAAGVRQPTSLLQYRLLHASPPACGPPEEGLDEAALKRTEQNFARLLRFLVLMVIAALAFKILPTLGGSWVQQSIALLRAPSAFMAAAGASRLGHLAAWDLTFPAVLEHGGPQALLDLLRTNSDSGVQKAALQALQKIADREEGLRALQAIGARRVVQGFGAPEDLGFIEEGEQGGQAAGGEPEVREAAQALLARLQGREPDQLGALIEEERLQ